MSTLVVPQVSSGLSTEELSDLVAKLAKDVDWFSRNIDSKNVRNIAGYNVSEFEIKHMSGIVGMSGYDYANPNAIRFWSGSANKEGAPFRVTQGGKLYATDGNFTGNITGSVITGGEIYGAYIATADGTFPRIEFSSVDNLLNAYNTASKYVSITPNQGTTPGIAWHDGSLVSYMVAEESIGVLLAAFGVGHITLDSFNNINLNPDGSLRINGKNGWTGTISVITDVDFTNQSTEFGIIVVDKGIITNYA